MAERDIIMVCSPGYLDAVMSCITRYSGFWVSGYSEVSEGIADLKRIPGNNLLGVSYLNDSILAKDVNPLRELLNKLNIMYTDRVTKDEEKLPFIFLLSAKLGGQRGTGAFVDSVLSGLNLDNIKIGYSNYSLVTDTLIKADMFGSILLRRRTFEKIETERESTENNQEHLHIELPFERKFLDLFAQLTFVEVDEFLKKYEDDELWCAIRRYMYDLTEENMNEIKRLRRGLSFDVAVPYDVCLRNLDLVERWGYHVRKQI
ncbi:hypothetical protein AGMMS49975_10130 [Clostridia bacterium]|nr:hypothetical protein AGMMS49975_10130 [Clostridia bacterium]